MSAKTTRPVNSFASPSEKKIFLRTKTSPRTGVTISEILLPEKLETKFDVLTQDADIL
jgi:hypothetical protein